MACESDDCMTRKCFTIIWKIENASYWWADDIITSPSFTVEEIYGTTWNLNLNLSIAETNDHISFRLVRTDDNKRLNWVEIDCELAFLSADGTVLHSCEENNARIEKNESVEDYLFLLRREVFFERSKFLHQDTLTARCRMWKSVGEMSKHVHCYALTRIAVEKRSFQWKIEEFSLLETDETQTCDIKSHSNDEQLFNLELSLTDGRIYDQQIRFKIVPSFQYAKISSIQLSIVDASKNTVKCFQEEFWHAEYSDAKYTTLPYTVTDLMEKKHRFLPDDILSLMCECTFCSGKVEIEYIDCTIKNKELDNYGSMKENAIGILTNDFKSMLSDGVHSDIKLKTSSHTYPAHKCILSARSPVFKAMFSSDMKEDMNDCVPIEDMNDATVSLLLQYMYSADVDELDWESATALYEAADKYLILDLKDTCSSYLKRNLSANNACGALVLADMHQDEDLKAFLQDFIISHLKDVTNSEEWEQLEETDLKLAYETMCFRFKGKSK